MWQSILYPPIFVRIIDTCLRFLFGWTANNISPLQKLAAYPHLYSYSSTKSVVHWFQIIRNGTFQMYDDDAPSPLSNRSKYYKVAKFPTRNIKTPIVLIYGGADGLVDINVMLKELPRHTIAKEIPHYEHLDFLWGESVDTLVFPHIFDALEKHTPTDGSHLLEGQKEKRWRSPGRYRGLLPHSEYAPSADDDHDAGDESASSPIAHRSRKVPTCSRRPLSMDEAVLEDLSITQSSPVAESRIPHLASYEARTKGVPSPPRRSIMSPPPTSRLPGNTGSSPNASVGESQATNLTSTSRPEGWWSSDDVAGTEASQPTTPRRRGSFDSQRSGKSLAGRFGNKGISLGVGRPVSSVVVEEGHGEHGFDERKGEHLLERAGEEGRGKKGVKGVLRKKKVVVE